MGLIPFVFDINTQDRNIIDENTRLNYDYYNNEFNASDISIETSVISISNLFASINPMNSFSNKNIAINYYNTPNKPNLNYPDDSMKYNAKSIRLFGLLHNNIKNVTCEENGSLKQNSKIVGELVIENTSITGYNRIYTCFLLKQSNGNKSNSLDNLIQQYELADKDKNIAKLELNDYIKNDSCITYTNNNNIIIVFTKPLVLNTSGDIIKKYSTSTSLFDIAPLDNNYKLIRQTAKNKNNNNNVISKQLGNEIYIDCADTGASAEEIATYNVPINSEYTKDAGKLEFMKITIHLCFVMMMLLVVYFLVPIFYKNVVIDNVNKFIVDKREVYPEELIKVGKPVNRFIRIRSIDTLLTVIFATLFTILVYFGYVAKDNFDFILYALYLAIMFGLSFATIQLSKTNIDFMKSKMEWGSGSVINWLYPEELPNKSPVNYLQLGDLVSFGAASVSFVFTGKRGLVFIIIFCLMFLSSLILFLCNFFGAINNNSFYILLSFFLVSIVTVIPTVLISHEKGPTC
jgi:hypothetical protein